MLKTCFFCLVWFQVFFLPISASRFRRLGLPNRGFRMEGIANIDFSWKSFLMNFGIDFYRFLDASGAVFLTFQASKTSLKTERLFMKPIISSPGSGGGDPRVFGPFTDIKA